MRFIGRGSNVTALMLFAALRTQGQTPDLPPPLPMPKASAKPSAAPGPMVGYEIRWISTSSPEWRGKFDTRLQILVRQAGSSVWSIDSGTLHDLLNEFQKDPRCNILQSPKVTTPVNQTAQVVNEESVSYVAHMRPVIPKPHESAPKSAFEPEVDKVQDGIRLRLSSGQLLPQEGIRVHVSLEETRLIRIHTTRVTHVAAAKPGESSANESRIGKLFHSAGADSGSQVQTSTIQVPEVVWSTIEGNWLIPKDGALLMSAGPRTIAGRRGKETYAERVVAISFQVPESPGSVQTPVANASPLP